MLKGGSYDVVAGMRLRAVPTQRCVMPRLVVGEPRSDGAIRAWGDLFPARPVPPSPLNKFGRGHVVSTPANRMVRLVSLV